MLKLNTYLKEQNVRFSLYSKKSKVWVGYKINQQEAYQFHLIFIEVGLKLDF